MARYPGAHWRPLGVQTQARMRRVDIICLHTMVGSLWGTDRYFMSNGYGGTESHFGVGHDGEVIQWQDTEYTADANYRGSWHIVSIETADTGTGFPRWNTQDGSAVPAWTDKQVEELARLVAWNCRVHDVPCELIDNSKLGQRGIGYHRQGVPGFMVAGGEQWSTARGKVCPGDRRVAQIPAIIERAREILGGAKTGHEFVSVPVEAEPMRYVNLDNPTGSTPDRAASLTIDPVGHSVVMPRGARAWLQWQAFFPMGPDGQWLPKGWDGKARFEWLVMNRVTGSPVPFDPFDLRHTSFGAIELVPGTNSVEVVIRGLPRGGAVGLHLDGIGHA